MKVYFDGNFWGHGKYQKPCRKLNIERSFEWKGFHWQLLGVYVCGRGLVLDFAKQIPVEDILEFMGKWKAVLDRQWNPGAQEEKELTEVERSVLEYENPMETAMNVKAWVNGHGIESIGGCCCTYNPLAGGRKKEPVDEEAGKLLEAYGLDASYGWSFCRMTLMWDYKRIPKKLKLRLLLQPDKYHIPCETVFETRTGEKGKTVTFLHPFEKTSHKLVVEDVTEEKLDETAFGERRETYIFPLHFQNLEYRLHRAEDEERFFVLDTEKGDMPIRKTTAAAGAFAASSVSVIGGASGPTSIFWAGRVRRESGEEKSNVKGQCSRLCFQPVTNTRWQVYAIVSKGEQQSLELEF